MINKIFLQLIFITIFCGECFCVPAIEPNTKHRGAELLGISNDSAIPKRNAIKLQLSLSNFTLGYERVLTNKINFEFKCGYIWVPSLFFSDNYPGDNSSTNGALVKIGIKCVVKPKIFRKGAISQPQLNGLYLKPEIFNKLRMTLYSDNLETNYFENNGGLQLLFGYEFFVTKSLLIDLYAGWGLNYRYVSSVNNSIIRLAPFKSCIYPNISLGICVGFSFK